MPVVSAARSSGVRLASATASLEAASRNCVKRAMRRASLGSMSCSSGLKSLTSAAIFTGQLLASKSVMGPTPHLPSRMAAQKSLMFLPMGVTAPIPVITTRLLVMEGNIEKIHVYSKDDFLFFIYTYR